MRPNPFTCTDFAPITWGEVFSRFDRIAAEAEALAITLEAERESVIRDLLAQGSHMRTFDVEGL